MFDFQKLEVYRKSRIFNREIQELLKITSIDQVSRNQLKRASISITLNIAEGSGRFTNADRKNFFTISSSSIYECVAILEILKDYHAPFNEKYEELLCLCDEMSRILYTMIKNLSS